MSTAEKKNKEYGTEGVLMLMAEIGAPVVVDGIYHAFFSPDAYKWISIAGRAGLAGLEEAPF